MTFIDQNTSREDLQIAILNERALYSMVNEAKFLNDEYSDDELLTIIRDWIEAGDECAR
jgi:hypothetical protein